jgi:hypothetical protein
MQAWITLAAQLGYPYYAMSSGGSLDNYMRTGIWSKYPITGTDLIKETYYDPTAVEIMRWPIVATIEVPGALYPLHVSSTHNKAGTTTKSARLQRAFEMRRIVQYFDRLVASNPTENVQYAIMGDFNDDIALTQNADFDLAYYQSVDQDLGNATATFNDGSDVPWNTNASWTLPYSKYPTERLSYANLGWINPFHTGTNLTWTHYYTTESGRYRLDYILFSDEIMNSAYGAPTGEIYNAEFDGPGVGLYKPGPVPPSNTSMDASDHRMVFADFHLIDAVPGITPVAILSEVVDHAYTNGTYVEICNSGSSALDLTGYELGVYLNGSTNPTKIALSGSIAGGDTHVVATSTNGFQTYWGLTPDQTAGIVGSLNGNDVVALLKPNGSVSDVYGQIGAVPGAWTFTDKAAARKAGVSDPIATWDSNEWTIVSYTNATPGWHQALAAAEAYVSAGPALDPAAPKATNTFAISVGITPNMLASNLAVTGVFRVAGGSWIGAAMTNSGTAWQTPQLNVSKEQGDVLDYYVRFSFQGPEGLHVNFSATNAYMFPVFGSSTNLSPMFNEVQCNGNGADSNDFFEIIAPAGMNLSGYKVEHRNGGSTDGAVWTFTFPSFVVPDDGVLAAGDVPLGFAVVGYDSNTVANADFLLPTDMLASGDGLILYDPEGAVLDAVVWLGDTYDIDVDDPGSNVVSRLVPPGSKNYLHEIGTDSSTDTCPQAPNNVLMSTGNWYNATMSPGAINVQQTSGSIVMAPGDSDLDAFLDDVDNCPDSFNPTQTDTDGDGRPRRAVRSGHRRRRRPERQRQLPVHPEREPVGHRRRRHRRRLRSGRRRRRHSERGRSRAVQHRHPEHGFRGFLLEGDLHGLLPPRHRGAPMDPDQRHRYFADDGRQFGRHPRRPVARSFGQHPPRGGPDQRHRRFRMGLRPLQEQFGLQHPGTIQRRRRVGERVDGQHQGRDLAADQCHDCRRGRSRRVPVRLDRGQQPSICQRRQRVAQELRSAGDRHRGVLAGRGRVRGVQRVGHHEQLHDRSGGPPVHRDLRADQPGGNRHVHRHGRHSRRRLPARRDVCLHQFRRDHPGRGHLRDVRADLDRLRWFGAHQRLHRHHGLGLVGQLFAVHSGESGIYDATVTVTGTPTTRAARSFSATP